MLEYEKGVHYLNIKKSILILENIIGHWNQMINDKTNAHS